MRLLQNDSEKESTDASSSQKENFEILENHFVRQPDLLYSIDKRDLELSKKGDSNASLKILNALRIDYEKKQQESIAPSAESLTAHEVAHLKAEHSYFTLSDVRLSLKSFIMLVFV